MFFFFLLSRSVQQVWTSTIIIELGMKTHLLPCFLWRCSLRVWFCNLLVSELEALLFSWNNPDEGREMTLICCLLLDHWVDILFSRSAFCVRMELMTARRHTSSNGNWFFICFVFRFIARELKKIICFRLRDETFAIKFTRLSVKFIKKS